MAGTSTARNEALSVEKLDPETIPSGSVIGVYGKVGCGKTTLIADILQKMAYIDYGYVLTESKENYIQKFPHFRYSDEASIGKDVSHILALQKNSAKEHRRHVCIVFDTDFSKYASKRYMRELFINSHRTNISFIFTLQGLYRRVTDTEEEVITSIPIDLMINLDYWLSGPVREEAERQYWLKSYTDIFGDEQVDIFNNMMKMCLRDRHSFFGCIMATRSPMWYKADPPRSTADYDKDIAMFFKQKIKI